MAMIPLTNSFARCPEGVQVFRIYKVEYDEEFGKLRVYLVNAQGITHLEKYYFMRNDKTINEQACSIFSHFAKTALNDTSIEEVDPLTLVDHYIKANVVHTTQPNKNDPTKTVTFVNLGDKWVADGFDTTPVAKALNLGKEATATPVAQPTPAPATGLDLNAILNG